MSPIGISSHGKINNTINLSHYANTLWSLQDYFTSFDHVEISIGNSLSHREHLADCYHVEVIVFY